MRRHPLGALLAFGAATRFRVGRSRGMQGAFRTLTWQPFDTEASPVRQTRSDRQRVRKPEGPSLSPGRKGLVSRPPPKRRLQTRPRTRLVNQLPDPPRCAVSSPSVVRDVDHVRRRPAQPLSGPCPRSLGDRRKGKRSVTSWRPISVHSFRETRRVFACCRASRRKLVRTRKTPRKYRPKPQPSRGSLPFALRPKGRSAPSFRRTLSDSSSLLRGRPCCSDQEGRGSIE